MMAVNTDCLYSTVKNTSGVTKKFGFLGAHGKELAAAEEFTEFGNIITNISAGDGGPRAVTSLEAALQAGEIDIIATPSPVLYDVTNDASKRLVVDGGALYSSDACWDAASSLVAL